MLGIVFFFTAFITIITTNAYNERELDTIINVLQRRVKNEGTSDDSSSSSERDNAPNSAGYRLKTMDVIDLIQEANKKNALSQNDNYYYKQKFSPEILNKATKYHESYQHVPHKYYKKDDFLNKYSDQLAVEENKPLKKRLTPNRLLDSVNYSNDPKKTDSQNGYSKILVVLDPNALQNSRNADDISKLVSKILSQSVKAVDRTRQEKNRLHRYKGFLVKDSSRRFRMASKENDGGGDDNAEDYRPKRLRSERGGGGGGTGRTAIPYIRHRGDIYEREH